MNIMKETVFKENLFTYIPETATCKTNPQERERKQH